MDGSEARELAEARRRLDAELNVSSDALIVVRELTKDYVMGDVEVTRAARRDPRHRAGRVRGGDGPVGLGQVHAHEHPRLPRPRRPRGQYLLDGQRRRAASTATSCADIRNAQDRLRLPGLQPARRAPPRSRTWSCRCSTPAWPTRERRRARARRALERGGPGRAARPPPEPALRRPAAARGHRARARQRPAAAPRRRADRQPRHRAPASR